MLTVKLGITEQSTLNTVFFFHCLNIPRHCVTDSPSCSCFDIHSPRNLPPSPLTPDRAAFLHVKLISHVSPTKKRTAWDPHCKVWSMRRGKKKKRQCFLYLTFFLSCPSIASSFPLLSVKMGKINCFQSSWLNGVHRARTEFWQMTQI